MGNSVWGHENILNRLFLIDSKLNRDLMEEVAIEPFEVAAA